MADWKSENVRNLARALLSLKTEPEMLAFLRDVATLSELKELASRFEAASELDQRFSQRDVAKMTGLGIATVTRINHWLRHGEGGYRLTLQRAKKHTKSRS